MTRQPSIGGLEVRLVCRRAARLCTVLAVGAVAAFLASGPARAAGNSRAAHLKSSRSADAASLGQWTPVAPTLGGWQAGTPAIWLAPNDTATIMWGRSPQNNQIRHTKPLTSEPPALSSASRSASSARPTGTRSRSNRRSWATGASRSPSSAGVAPSPRTPTAASWATSRVARAGLCSSWSLSASCSGTIGGAAEAPNGTLSAAWSGGWANGHGILYRVGTSPKIPAAGTDAHIAVGTPDGTTKPVEASDSAGNGHIYVEFGESSPTASTEGLYLKDVSANGPVVKVPGSGQWSQSQLGVQNLAIANTNTHAGIYLAYCSNTHVCSVLLWHAGSAKPIAVPGSYETSQVAISAGPSGSLWLSWYNRQNNRVSVVKTNAADTAFGKIATYKTPCTNGGFLAMTSGTFARVDIAMSCGNNNEVYFTQSAGG